MQTILLIGSGRLSKHLVYWNSQLKKPNDLLTWNRHQPKRILKKLLAQADLVWLAISDSALLDFYDQNLSACKKPVVHFSGAFFDERISSAHPLMSFPLKLMKSDIYKKIYFALTGSKNLQKILPGFKNNFFILKPRDKAHYHALCVLAGNFPQMIWTEVLHDLKKLNIPAEALKIYIRQITENFLQLEDKSLTGPLIRKDFLTIQKNQNALKNLKLKKIYATFTEVFAK